MSEFNYDKWINLLIWVTAVSAIISAFALLSFRVISNKKSSASFKKIEDAQLKAIEEINEQKELINQKIKNAADSMINELNEKTTETGLAIDSLKGETTKAAEKIQSEIRNVQKSANLLKSNIINNPVRITYDLEITTNLHTKVEWEEFEAYINSFINAFNYQLSITGMRQEEKKHASLILDNSDIVQSSTSSNLTTSCFYITKMDDYDGLENRFILITYNFILNTGSLENLKEGDVLDLRQFLKSSEFFKYKELLKHSKLWRPVLRIAGFQYNLVLKNSTEHQFSREKDWGFIHKFLIEKKL